MTGTIEDLFTLLKDLAHGGGHADPDALRQAQHAIGSLRWNDRLSDYAKGKLGEAEGWFEVLYSHRKHQRHAGGASQVRVWILGNLAVAQRQPRRDRYGGHGT